MLQLTFPCQNQVSDALTEEQDERALKMMFDLLHEFLAKRDHSGES
jgi:hypothetical protein